VRSILLYLALPALLLASGAEAASAARPAGAGLRVDVLSCVTGNTHVAARQGCGEAPGVGHEGSQHSGLDDVLALSTGGNGASLYAVGNANSALTQLSLERPSQALSFLSCLTGNKFVDACTQLPGATHNAPEAPVSYPTGAAISPDGRSLYLVSGNFHASVVARFARDPLSGALTYLGCLTGDLGAGPTGPAGCQALPTATREGYGSGLYEASGIAIDADGRRIYVTAAGDGGVAAFDRDPAGGALTFLGCVSSNPKASGCVRAPGGDPILEGLGAPFLSPDGRHLYAGASRAATVATFALGGPVGIRFAGCIGGREDWKPCRRGRPSGPVAALSNPWDIAGSADGRFLYASSSYGSIVVLKRNRSTGTLTATSCISSRDEDRGRCARVPATPRRTGGRHHASLLTGVRRPLLSANGRTVYVPIRTIDGIARLGRNAKSGALTFRACATGDLQLATSRKGPCQPLPKATRDGTGSGFYKTTALVSAPGGLLYAASSADATVSLLRP
jgi:DNA-binding beta-propeller fold protein YncE